MKVNFIDENSSIDIEDEYRTKIKEILDNNPLLPIRLNGKTLHFNDYTIGEFRVGDFVVNIKPRNKAFSLEDFFQILQFIDRPLLNDLDGYGFGTAKSLFNFHDISKQYCNICSNLVQFGLTGSYSDEFTYEKKVNGDIVFSKYRTQLIPYHGLPLSVSNYDLNIPANQIIRAALFKLMEIEKNNENTKKYQLARDLDQVEDAQFTLEDIRLVIETFYTTNPYYIPALELASRILFSLQLEYKNGNIEWLAFLENSNTIFESYILQILDLFLGEDIRKWKSPKNFAKLNAGKRTGEKSYNPDILINYNRSQNSASIVLDVKNKAFEPGGKSSLSDLVSTGDLYQLLFYCHQLKTNFGGLIYPSSTNNEPIRITFDIDADIQIYLFSINMSLNMKERHTQLICDITNHLISKT